MKQNKETNKGVDVGTTNSEANAQVAAHGINEMDSYVDLASVTVKYSVYTSCLLLLSSLQLHFMCEEKGPSSLVKKKKAGHSNEVYAEKEKDTYHDQQQRERERERLGGRATTNSHFVRDYEMFHAEQKRPQLNDPAACPIPLYKKR
ncbi:hypothetical protein AK88_03672 [Plasmodium fragile]|uniref:Uncharacterized protein n=1 Tax=Plasmodium fragile TaxID=5857 RepID=A0A0D9QHX9_PLAFR|nr:uncharacterized protein AK88_03672 [Plasmodium fragile]KJP86665.1 hypothetical protein AK88_03672 [Plasmodium fragile]